MQTGFQNAQHKTEIMQITDKPIIYSFISLVIFIPYK